MRKTKRPIKSVTLVVAMILCCVGQLALGRKPVLAATRQAAPATAIEAPFSYSLGAALMKLREIRVKELDTDIPVTAKPLLTKVKEELCGIIEEILNNPDLRGVEPQGMRARVVSRLKSMGVAIAEPSTSATEAAASTSPPFGTLLGLTLAIPDGYPNLLVATTTLSIPCGEDSSLYLFERQADGWRLVLAQEANDYDSISDAQGSMGYVIGPAGGGQPFFVVMVSVNPWCTSNWQGIRYTVMRPGKTAYQPLILFSTTDTIYLGNDNGYRMTATPSGFTVEFDSSAPDNSDEVSAPKRIEYQVRGNKVAEQR